MAMPVFIGIVLSEKRILSYICCAKVGLRIGRRALVRAEPLALALRTAFLSHTLSRAHGIHVYIMAYIYAHGIHIYIMSSLLVIHSSEADHRC